MNFHNNICTPLGHEWGIAAELDRIAKTLLRMEKIAEVVKIDNEWGMAGWYAGGRKSGVTLRGADRSSQEMTDDDAAD